MVRTFDRHCPRPNRISMSGERKRKSESESEREDRIYYLAACSTSLAETMGKRESRYGPGTLEHHFRLSISHSLKSLLRPIRHAYWLYNTAIAFGHIRVRAIIKPGETAVSREYFAMCSRFVKLKVRYSRYISVS